MWHMSHVLRDVACVNPTTLYESHPKDVFNLSRPLPYQQVEQLIAMASVVCSAQQFTDGLFSWSIDEEPGGM